MSRAHDWAAMAPWLAVFVGFLAVYAWIRREWVWIVGDDQNLMMPAINIGQGFVPNIDFTNGYPGLTFYIQRLIMLVVGQTPISEHVYTAIQAASLAIVSAWVLRRYPAALTWLLILFIWTISFRLNPTPNPGSVTQALSILSIYWMGRSGTTHRVRDTVVAGVLAGIAFLFKQPGIFLPIVFLLYTSLVYLTWPDRPPGARRRGLVLGLNVAALIGFIWVYLGLSVFAVLDDLGLRDGLVLSSVAFVGPWVVAVIALVVAPNRITAGLDRQWSFGAIARANAVFSAVFAIIVAVGFMAMYGSPERIAVALRAVFIDSPQSINAVDSKVLQPLLLWPTVAIALLVLLSPFLIGAARSWLLRGGIFVAASAGCAYTALNYSDLQFTIVGTLIFILFVAIFLRRHPTDRTSWNRFFLFLAASILLAYVTPHPKYTYSLGLLAVTGWYMLESAAPAKWPTVANAAGFAILVGIAIMTLRWADAEARFITEFQLGNYAVRSYDSNFPAAVEAANASTIHDWFRNRHDYLVYLAHAP